MLDLRLGDCLDVLPTLDAQSVDAIVTDPPYALTNRVADVPACDFCGRQCGGQDKVKPGDACPRCGEKLVSRRTMSGAGFMGKDWDTGIVAFSPAIWTQALRVVKPGGYMLAFGGTRTFHRLMCAIEDTGWQIRDTLMWVYGSGFPKGKGCLKPAWEPIIWAQKPLNHSSETDIIIADTMILVEALLWHLAPARLAERLSSQLQASGESTARFLATTLDAARSLGKSDVTATFNSPEAASIFLSIAWLWNAILGVHCSSRSTSTIAIGINPITGLRILKSLISQITPEPIIRAAMANGGLWWCAKDAAGSLNGHVPGWKGIPKPSVHEDVTWPIADAIANALADIAESLLPPSRATNDSSAGMPAITLTGRPIVDAILSRTALPDVAPAWEPIILARKPGPKVLPLGIDVCRVGTEDDRSRPPRTPNAIFGGGNGTNITKSDSHPSGRWPANLVHDGSDEVVGLLGNAARFYYTPKASRAERNEGCEGLEERSAIGGMKATGLCRKCNRQEVNVSGQCQCDAPDFGPIERHMANHHPTVKPLALMQWLVRLVTPEGGIVLDPFMGSGTTGKAAIREGMQFIGIEREPEYLDIARARINAERAKHPLLSCG